MQIASMISKGVAVIRLRTSQETEGEAFGGGLSELRPLLPFLSLIIALGVVAWAHFFAEWTLFWAGVAVSRALSSTVVAAAVVCWHAALLAAGGPRRFGNLLVFVASAVLPVAIVLASLLEFFQLTTWVVRLAEAATAAVLGIGLTRAVFRGVRASELPGVALSRFAYGAATALFVLVLGAAIVGAAGFVVEGGPEGELDSQRAFDKVVESPPASASQQEMADAFASLAAAEASYLGFEEAPRVVVEFAPSAKHAARIEGDTIAVNARRFSENPSENAFYVIHEVFHLYQCRVASGEVDSARTVDSVARQLASQHAEDWGRELERYVSVYEDHSRYEDQWLERDADAYANITVGRLAGKVSYSGRARSLNRFARRVRCAAGSLFG